MTQNLDGYSYTGEGTHLGGNVTIGRYCSIANLCTIGAQEHNYKKFTTHAFAEDDGKKTVIEHDVWIGCNAVILSGVTVGTGAVIGAGSVVTHNVPPYAIVHGNPATVYHYRFPKDIIDALLASKWWELPLETVSKLPHEPEAAIAELRLLNPIDSPVPLPPV